MQRNEGYSIAHFRELILLLRKYNRYLLPLLFFGIATANWDKDFGIYPVVGLPSIIGQSQMSGFDWYRLAYIFEILLVASVVLVSYHPRTNLVLGVTYEIMQTLSFILFALEKAGRLELSLYGLVWNDMFWICAFPILLAMLYFANGSSSEVAEAYSARSLTADL